jgi:hemoglobin-like flavoprotein
MTDEQIALVKRTWKIFREIDPALIGDVFYSKLFIEVPQVKHLFKTSRDIQSKKLVEMLSTIVGRLDRLDELTEDIKQLALRHVDYGVKVTHYREVGAALLWMLQQGLGADWNKEVEAAWEACYETLASTMIKAAGYTRRDAI